MDTLRGMFDGLKFQEIANRWGKDRSRHTAEGHWKEVKIKMEAASQVDAIHKVYAMQIAQWLGEKGGGTGPSL